MGYVNRVLLGAMVLGLTVFLGSLAMVKFLLWAGGALPWALAFALGALVVYFMALLMASNSQLRKQEFQVDMRVNRAFEDGLARARRDFISKVNLMFSARDMRAGWRIPQDPDQIAMWQRHQDICDDVQDWLRPYMKGYGDKLPEYLPKPIRDARLQEAAEDTADV